jgi:hypothetical protein
VDERWEQEPSVLALRVALETAFEERLREAVNPWITANGGGPIHDRLRRLIETAPSPALSRWLEREATLEQFREFVIHRSAYHLMEADPHSFGIPRFTGAAKAALVEIQFDEYGGGREPRMHASLFRDTMLGLGLDARPGAYLDRIPGITLATVNAASMFALARRWRAALTGHLAIFEMTSCRPNRSYGNALRRLGFGAEVTRFYDEHVEADAVHELVASRKLAGAIVEEEPDLQEDVLFGAAACLTLEARAADHMLRSWKDGRSSLLP